MKLDLRYVEIPVRHAREAEVLRVVGDGAIATGPIADGRLVPLVILDTGNRPDVAEYIRLHEHFEAGDVVVQWGQVEGHEGTVALFLTFQRPAEVIAVIEFELERNHGILVEQILAARALYIQAGKHGDRLKHDLSRSKVILEVPDMGFARVWDDLHRGHVAKRFRRSGLNRQQARRAAIELINHMKQLKEIRMPVR